MTRVLSDRTGLLSCAHPVELNRSQELTDVPASAGGPPGDSFTPNFRSVPLSNRSMLLRCWKMMIRPMPTTPAAHHPETTPNRARTTTTSRQRIAVRIDASQTQRVRQTTNTTHNPKKSSHGNMATEAPPPVAIPFPPFIRMYGDQQCPAVAATALAAIAQLGRSAMRPITTGITPL